MPQDGEEAAPVHDVFTRIGIDVQDAISEAVDTKSVTSTGTGEGHYLATGCDQVRKDGSKLWTGRTRRDLSNRGPIQQGRGRFRSATMSMHPAL